MKRNGEMRFGVIASEPNHKFNQSRYFVRINEISHNNQSQKYIILNFEVHLQTHLKSSVRTFEIISISFINDSKKQIFESEKLNAGKTVPPSFLLCDWAILEFQIQMKEEFQDVFTNNYSIELEFKTTTTTDVIFIETIEFNPTLRDIANAKYQIEPGPISLPNSHY
ncbi:MAG: hypothetical protein AB9891_22070 [Anaerolineaceae bacterium]